MRWKGLFDDLEAELDAAKRLELEAEVRDRTRLERGRVRTVDRLRTGGGERVTLTVLCPVPPTGVEAVVSGALQDVGPDWLLLEDDTGRDVLVPLAALASVSGAPRASSPPEGVVEERLDLRWALRGLARDRVVLRLQLLSGAVVSGTLERVAADHVDVAVRVAGELRPAGTTRLVPLAALALLRPER